MKASAVFLTAMLSVLFLSCFAGFAYSSEGSDMASVMYWAKDLFEKNAGLSNQVLLVVGQKCASTSAKIYLFERCGNAWNLVGGHIDASIGRNGFAPTGKKREGDGKTPSGVYTLDFAFGYSSGVNTKMNYFQTTEDDIWVDDARSVDYNRWVKKGHTNAKSYEDMRRKDDLYKYVVVTGYNTKPVVSGRGSAIFLHVRGGQGKPTAGCVAVAEGDMLKVLGWLDPSKKPIIMMGTEEAIGYLEKE